jgi:hypothetical protein
MFSLSVLYNHTQCIYNKIVNAKRDKKKKLAC